MDGGLLTPPRVPTSRGAGGVFLCYRREDAEGYAGRLCDRLRQRFGPEAVFMDVDAIALGADWVAAMEAALASCSALVVLVGPRWLSAATASGGRRLDDPADPVAAEVAAALARGVLVVPVLVGGAVMPIEAELPPGLAPLARCNALRLDHTRFDDDVARLVEALSSVVPLLERPAPEKGPRHNLPAALTSFVGRERERAEVAGLLATTRLLTLTGAGGCGKTRLALEVAGEAVEAYPDGVWLAELAPLADRALVTATAATALGVREEAGRALSETLAGYLSGRDLLLVLDNCEHLVDAAAALVAALLPAAPRLRVLATSREPLGVPGEVAWRVPSLAAPNGAASLVPEALVAFDAVRLFVERAKAAAPAFALSAANAAAVARVCSRLDGIPLALELAAARLRSLTPAEVDARLGDRFGLLRGGARTVPSRQQTLEAAIDWSHDLLSAPERVCLHRLAIFAGSFGLESAEAVCADDALDAADVLDLISALVDKSLVVAEETGGATRFRMLETIRAYAARRLGDAGDDKATRERHLGFFTALAERAEPEFTGADQGVWLERLEADHDNLRAALDWATAERCADALRLAGALWRFWYVRGHWSEGRRLLEAALGGAGRAPLPRRALALKALGNLAYAQGDYPQARSLYEEAVALYRELGDRSGVSACLVNLGNVAHDQGDYPQARSLFEEALALYRELGDRSGVDFCLSNLGNVAHDQGDYAQARLLYEEALALGRELGDRMGVAFCLSHLGSVANDQGDYPQARSLLEEGLTLFRELGHRKGVAFCITILGNLAWAQGDYPQARSLYEEALALGRDLGDRSGVAFCLSHLGSVANDQGDYPQARSLLEEGLALFRELGDRKGCAACLEGFARLAAAEGRHDRGARLLGAGEALREAIGASLPALEQARRDETLATLEAGLGEDALHAALAAGQALSLEDALAYAAEDDPEKQSVAE